MMKGNPLEISSVSLVHQIHGLSIHKIIKLLLIMSIMEQ